MSRELYDFYDMAYNFLHSVEVKVQLHVKLADIKVTFLKSKAYIPKTTMKKKNFPLENFFYEEINKSKFPLGRIHFVSVTAVQRPSMTFYSFRT